MITRRPKRFGRMRTTSPGQGFGQPGKSPAALSAISASLTPTALRRTQVIRPALQQDAVGHMVGYPHRLTAYCPEATVVDDVEADAPSEQCLHGRRWRTNGNQPGARSRMLMPQGHGHGHPLGRPARSAPPPSSTCWAFGASRFGRRARPARSGARRTRTGGASARASRGSSGSAGAPRAWHREVAVRLCAARRCGRQVGRGGEVLHYLPYNGASMSMLKTMTRIVMTTRMPTRKTYSHAA